MDDKTLRTLATLLSAGGGANEEAPGLSELLAEADLGPRARLLASMLLEQQQTAEPTVAPEQVEPRTIPASERSSRVRAALQAAREELQALRELNDSLAYALGACPGCWGGDRACRDCRGRGSAGWAEPDPALFRMFVEPAVHAAGRDTEMKSRQPVVLDRGDVEPVQNNGGQDA